MAAAESGPPRLAIPSLLVAFIAVATASIIKLAITSFAGPGAPFLLYFGAIMVAAWYGGLWAGLLATALAALASWYVFLAPAWSFALDGGGVLRLLAFSFEGILISYLCAMLQTARSRAHVALQKVAEEKLATKESERQYRLMVENVRDYAMFMTDIEGRVSKWNTGAERLLGWSEEEILGQFGGLIFTREDQEARAPQKELEQARENGHAEDERWHVRKNGSRFFASGMMMAVKDEAGRCIGYTKVLRDETERRRAEVQLRESERRVRLLLDSTAEGIYGIDQKGCCTFANTACARLLGYTSPEELIGEDVHELVHHHHEDGTPYSSEECCIHRGLEKGEGVHVDDEVFWRKDGTSFPAEYWSYPAVVTEGQVELAVVTFLDITERRRSETELREGKARLSAALAIANLGTFEWNVATDEVTLDERSREIFGFGPGEGTTAQEVFRRVHPADFERVHSAATASQETISGLEIEYRIILPDGTGRTIVSISDAVPGADGKAVRMFGVFSDITERKRTEAILRASEEQHRAVLATLKEGVILHDSRGNIVMANASAERILGLTLDQMRGLDSYDSRWSALAEDGTPLSGDKHPAQIALETSKPVTEAVMNVRRPDGTRVWISVNAIPVRDPRTEEFTGVVASFFDITTRKAEEEEREELLARERAAREIAETANAAKDRFLAVLSHELRNPLAPVLTSASLMLTDDRLPRDLREEAATIQRNAQLEARLIDDLLDLSRVAKGKMHMEMRPVEIESLITQSFTICKPELQAKNLRVSFTHRASRSTVMGDPARLQQVLWNLLRNAIKFTAHDTEIRIGTENTEDETLIVRVVDEGVGIAPEDQERIFGPFEQAVNTSQFGGLGLGLAISRTLAELHGGTLRVESAGYGHGATFVLTLPTLAESAATVQGTPLSPTAETPARSLRVLLVEDNLDAVRTLARLLTRRGHTVLTATSVDEALNTAADHEFDVLVSDIGLGEKSGLELMRSLHASHPGLPGIALSGYGMETDVTKSMEAGFTVHLTKPVDPEALQEALLSVTKQ